MAGVAGGRTIGGAERGCGTILRGAGAAGAAGAATAGFAGGGASFTGALTVAAGAAGLAATCGWRASSSSSFFLARIAFSTSPGLEMCDRSIFGVIVEAALREDPVPAWVAERAPCEKCARTLFASSSSSELEWVLPAPIPISARTSRTCLLLTSSSRARSLIRTLLIRLFSVILCPMHSVAHSYLVTLADSQTCVNDHFVWEVGAHLTRRPRQPLSLPRYLRFRLPRSGFRSPCQVRAGPLRI